MADCLFCRIIRGEVPSKKVYEDEHTLAFDDINPQAQTHVLVIPKKHIAGLKEAGADDAELVGYCHLAAAEIARQRSIENGYRTVLNVGPGAGQSVFHMHVHLLGGRALKWPPGEGSSQDLVSYTQQPLALASPKGPPSLQLRSHLCT